MAKLIYSMIQSVDGYTEDAQGDFSWGAPDEDVRLDLALLEQRRFGNGVVVLRYGVRR